MFLYFNFIFGLKRKLILCISFFFFTLSSFSQDNTPYFLKNSDWLPASDAKKWEKLVNQIPDAEKLVKQSNDCYLQIANIEAKTDIDENKKQKQTAKIETQAVDYYNQSLKKYKEIYVDVYAIITKNIDEAKKTHPAYSEMTNYNSQAAIIYSSIINPANDQDREQLSQANEYQLLAIEKGVNVFNMPQSSYASSTTPDITTENTSQSIDSGDIQLNSEFYNKYKDYISNTSNPDPVVISQLMQMEGDDASFGAFKEMWNRYLAIEGENQMGQQQIAEAVAQTDSLNRQDSTGAELAQNNQSGENITGTASGTTSTSKTTSTAKNKSGKSDVAATEDKKSSKNKSGKEPNKQNENENIPASLFESSVAVVTDYPEYRVQLAASRIPLNLYQISSIYNGALTVTEVKDGNLYKYQIRSFCLFTDAQSVCSQTKVDNAYLAAYKGPKMLNLGEAIRKTRPLESQVKKAGKEKVIHEIEFSVQVAASKVRLTSAQLSQLYSGQWPVSIVFEEGWYKYQILAGTNLQEALNILSNCGDDKAFLVAYKNGKKLLLYKALQEYKSYTP
jgi:hypothetical protein